MCQFELFAPGLGVSTSQICVQQVKIVQKKLVQLSTQGGAGGVLGPGNYWACSGHDVLALPIIYSFLIVQF